MTTNYKGHKIQVICMPSGGYVATAYDLNNTPVIHSANYSKFDDDENERAALRDCKAQIDFITE